MPATAKPSLRFYHSKELRKRTLTLLDALDAARDARQHHQALAELIVALSEAGMGYYYLEPLKLAKAGFVVRQSASLTLSAAMRVLAPMTRTAIGRLDHKQLRVIGKFMRGLMD